MGVAALLVVLALAWPLMSARSFRGLVESATADVETLRTAATGTRNQTGAWPAASAPGRIPGNLTGAFASDTSWVRNDYSLQWRTFEIVEQVEIPPAALEIPADADQPPDSVGPEMRDVVALVGAIVVHTANDALSAALLQAYGPEDSFVRDTAWTLILRPGSGSQ